MENIKKVSLFLGILVAYLFLHHMHQSEQQKLREDNKKYDGTENMKSATDFEHKEYSDTPSDKNSYLSAAGYSEKLCQEALSRTTHETDEKFDNFSDYKGNGFWEVDITIRQAIPSALMGVDGIWFQGKCVVNNETKQVISKEQLQ